MGRNKEWTYVNMLLIDFAVQQKLTQHYKATTIKILKTNNRNSFLENKTKQGKEGACN